MQKHNVRRFMNMPFLTWSLLFEWLGVNTQGVSVPLCENEMEIEYKHYDGSTIETRTKEAALRTVPW